MTWAEVDSAWPGTHEIGVLEDFLNEALTSQRPVRFISHPQNVSRTRSNYTLHRSRNGGGSEAVTASTPSGLGIQMPSLFPTLPHHRRRAHGVPENVEPPVSGIEGGGYDVGLADSPCRAAVLYKW